VNLPLILRPEAEVDAQVAYDQLAAVRPSLGEQFVARLRDVLGRIEADPEVYGIVWQGVRAVRLKRFRYLVYYVMLSDRNDVVLLNRLAPRLRVQRFVRRWSSTA
jgi:hypothetical protein